jgi:hypothetical protein
MPRIPRPLLAASAALLAAACAEGITSSDFGTSDLSGAFNTVLAGFSQTNNSFNASSDTTGHAYTPDGHGHGDGDHHRGGHGGPGGGGPGGDFMGGGFGPDFMGGPHGGRGPFGGGLPGDCTFSSSTGLITCAPVTHDGLTIVRSGQYLNTAGVAQSAVDSTTNTITLHVQVDGTVTRRDSAVSTIHHVSDRRVTGLAAGSTQRTVNGAAAGTENTVGHDTTGSYTALRTVGDTTRALVVPVTADKPSYPTSGTVIRAMTVTVTYSGQSPTTSSRREVITFDGSATARLVITQDGVTRNCTVPLPHGRPVCQ